MSSVIDLEQRRVRRAPFGRVAATERGEKVVDAVVAVAREHLMQRWLSEITLVEICAQASRTRSSVLLQFPGGIHDVVCTVATREFSLFDDGCNAAMSEPVRDPVARTMCAFEPLFAMAEKSGRLYANLRSAMFGWGDENQGVFRLGWSDYVDMTAELLTGAWPAGESSQVRHLGYLAEAVLNGALDITTAQGEWPSNWLERREAFRTLLEAVLGVSAAPFSTMHGPSTKTLKRRKKAAFKRKRRV